MNVIDKVIEEINGIPDPKGYIREMLTVIPARNGLTPDDLAGHLEAAGKRCAELLKTFGYSQLPAVFAELEQKAREAKLSLSRPSEATLTAARETIYSHGRAEGWTSGEMDTLRDIARGVKVAAINWHGAKLVDGREIDRVQVRASMRFASYSDEKWGEFLASLPKIQAPQVEGRSRDNNDCDQ